ncbi:MAG: Asp/Glu racemase [Alphaproteobacteria bacterium]|nr:Asp/Glu racemase [Alphaproteobacteria bacterium]
MRLLLINPNTTQAMTDKVLAVARAGVGEKVELVGATGRFGAAYVASRAAYAIAGHAALDAWANAEGHFDAVVLACFGDPGLDALREICPVPVVGMADASLMVAAQLGARIGVVTGGERWGPMLREFVAARGFADRVASIRTVAPTGADIARDPDGSLALLAQSCTAAVEEGADVVILGGAGLAGLAERMRERVPVPLVDGVLAAVGQAVALVGLGVGKATRGSLAPTPAVESTGLSAPLARRLGGH